MAKLLIDFDKKGAEWVVVAYLTGDARMLQVVEEGWDPHLITGCLISGAPEELVKADHDLVGNNTDPDTIYEIRVKGVPDLIDGDYFIPRTMSIRQCGKKSNHGLNYDMKFRRFALELEIEEREAKIIVTSYRTDAYPGIPVWHKTTRELLNKDRTLVNCFERKRVFMDAWGPELFDAAYSFIPQSTVFDITRTAMVKIYREIPGMDLLAQVHDSVLTQYDDSDLEEVAEVCGLIANDFMNPRMEYNSRSFQIKTDVKIGYKWGDENMKKVVISENKRETAVRISEALDSLNGKAA